MMVAHGVKLLLCVCCLQFLLCFQFLYFRFLNGLCGKNNMRQSAVCIPVNLNKRALSPACGVSGLRGDE